MISDSRTSGNACLNPNAPPSAYQHQMVRIAKGTAVVFAATFFGLGLNYVYSIFLARFLGAEQFGFYALGLTTFNLLSVISIAGLDSALLKFVPAHKARGDEAGVRGTVRTILALAFAFSSTLSVALLLASHLLATEIFHNPDMTRVLVFFGLAIPAFTISSLFISTLQALQEVRWRTFVKYVCEPVSKVILTAVLLWVGWNLDGALAAFVVSLVFTLTLTFVPLRHLFIGTQGLHVERGSVGEVLAFSTVVMGAWIIESITSRADILLLGYWASPDQVGVYSAAFQTSAIISLIFGSFDSIAAPFLSESFVRDDQSHLKQLYGLVVRWALIISLPLFLVMSLFPHEILSMFGKNFESGADCLVILAAGQIVNSAMAPANRVLLWAGHSRLVMWNSLFQGFIQIGLNLVLIPKYGIVGAAIATSTGLFLVNSLRALEAYVLLAVQPYQWNVLKPIISGIGAVIVVVLLRHYFLIQNVSAQIIMLVSFYFLLVAALGLDQDDRTVLGKFQKRLRRHAI